MFCSPNFYARCLSFSGKALDEIHLDDLDMGTLERELDKDMDANSVSSSISAGLSTSGCFSNNSSIPIGIPFSRIAQRGSISSLSQSPPSPFGSFPHSMQPLQLQKQDSNDHVIFHFHFFSLTIINTLVSNIKAPIVILKCTFLK